jgi:hypothetical protein
MLFVYLITLIGGKERILNFVVWSKVCLYLPVLYFRRRILITRLFEYAYSPDALIFILCIKKNQNTSHSPDPLILILHKPQLQ